MIVRHSYEICRLVCSSEIVVKVVYVVPSRCRCLSVGQGTEWQQSMFLNHVPKLDGQSHEGCWRNSVPATIVYELSVMNV